MSPDLPRPASDSYDRRRKAMATLIEILKATWGVFLVASPYVILGLGAAGLMTVLIPSEKISRWLGQPGFGATFRAACLGIPLPLCSCAVV
ncbi:MAG: permease, partial [Thermoanaerobaculia bacterium]